MENGKFQLKQQPNSNVFRFNNQSWKIFNVNWVGKNIRFKDDYLAPRAG